MKMKKVLFVVMMLFAGLTSASAQDIYKEIIHMSDSVANDARKPIEVRKIAKFKSNAIKYWAGKMMMEQFPENTDGNFDLSKVEVPASVWGEIDNQAIALYNYVHIFQTRLTRAEKEKDRRNILLLFKEASILFPRFNDPDTEFTQSYCNDNRFLTQFSLDTDWVKALAYVREKLGLPAK